MTFSVNNGPFAGKEGQFVTSRHIRDRLFKELERNVSLRVKETDSADSFEVCGRGELHLSVLIETMRREGFELLVSRPKVIIKEIDGVKCEPMERLVVNVPDECIGNVIPPSIVADIIIVCIFLTYISEIMCTKILFIICHCITLKQIQINRIINNTSTLQNIKHITIQVIHFLVF